MRRERTDQAQFFIGVLVSLVGHLLSAAIAIGVLESSSANAYKEPEVFSVTLEGGQVLGGISQVPLDDKKQKVLPAIAEQGSQPEENTEEEAKVAAKEESTKELTSPAVVDDPEKILAEKRAIEEKERKIREEKLLKEKERKEKLEEERAKKVEEEKKKKADDEKRRVEEQKKVEEDKKKKEELAKQERDKRLKKAIKAAANRYSGESANAGGEGFGAARLGGQGMGGGTLASLEFIAYQNQLQEHIKRGWRWLAGTEDLQAVVLIYILPTGVIQDAQIIRSSGRADFDDSCIRAVFKASPVPQPPAELYERFREVRITFDPKK